MRSFISDIFKWVVEKFVSIHRNSKRERNETETAGSCRDKFLADFQNWRGVYNVLLYRQKLIIPLHLMRPEIDRRRWGFSQFFFWKKKKKKNVSSPINIITSWNLSSSAAVFLSLRGDGVANQRSLTSSFPGRTDQLEWWTLHILTSLFLPPTATLFMNRFFFFFYVEIDKTQRGEF